MRVPRLRCSSCVLLATLMACSDSSDEQSNETDPVFASAPAANVTSDDIVHWRQAYGWGDHAAAGYASATLASGGWCRATADGSQIDCTHADMSFVRTVVVNPVPGDATASGAALLAAMSSIVGASATDPYRVKVEPGIYDIGDSALVMKPWVDIEGSGDAITQVTSQHSSDDANASSATLVGANNAELRLITIENTGGGVVSLAIYNQSASPTLRQVKAIASGGSNQSTAIYNQSSSPKMVDFLATANGADGTQAIGVYNIGSSPAMTRGVVTAAGANANAGVVNTGSAAPVLRMMQIQGGTYGLSNTDSASPTVEYSVINAITSVRNIDSSTARIAATRLEGPVSEDGCTCVGAYDANFVALGTDCL